MSTLHADNDSVIRELEALLDAGVASDDVAVHDAATPTEALAALLPRYRLNGLIGSGGMGQVYDAHDTLLQRRVAIKIVARPGPVVADLMRREREVLAALEHPGIVTVYDCGELPQGTPYYVMQYVEGDELRDYVARHQLTLAERLRLVAEIARSVGVAHLLKVVHRDLKPSNIKVAATGRPMILDFGLAKFTATPDLNDGNDSEDHTFQTVARGRIKGTLAYMSPEQAAGEPVDSRTDTYALGVLLYELLLERLPRDPKADGIKPLDWSHELRTNPVLLDDTAARQLPHEVRAILVRALDSKPNDRYPTGIELADDLEAFLEKRPVSAVRRMRGVYLARMLAVRHRKSIAVAAGILSVLAAVVVTAFLRIRAERNIAEQSAHQATTDRHLAVDRANATRRFLYAADMGQAHRLWQNRQVDKAQALLNRYLPKPGQEDLRTFEWRFLWKLCQNRPQNLVGHAANITVVQYSPDGRRLASGDEAGVIHIWDTHNGKRLATLNPSSSAIEHLGYCADGKTLFSISADRVMRVWDLPSRTSRQTFWWFWCHPTAAVCSSDGRRMAVADSAGWVYIWDTKTSQIPLLFSAHYLKRVCSVAFSPDGRQLATGSEDKAASVWDLATQRKLVTVESHLGAVDAVCFSPDGKYLATGGADHALRLWDIARPEQPEFGWISCDAIAKIGFGNQPGMVWAACKNGTLNYLNTVGPQRSTLPTDTIRLQSASVTADMRHIASASGDRTIHLWRDEQLVEYGHIPCAADLNPMRLVMSLRGDLLAVQYFDQRFVDVFNTSTRSLATRLEDFRHPVTAIRFTVEGDLLMTADSDGGAAAWDVRTGRPARSYSRGYDSRLSIGVSLPDGRVAIGGSGGVIDIYDAQGRMPLAQLKGHEHLPVVFLDFSRNGRTLASAGADKTIHLWDAQSGQLLHVLRGHQGMVYTVRFAPDGSRLASTSVDGTVRLWSRDTGAELTTLWRQPYETFGLCFTPDGRTLAASSADPGSMGSTEVHMWNMETLQETLALKLGGCRITGLRFSPDANQLYGGVGPGSTGAGVLVWEAEPAATNDPRSAVSP